MANPYLLDVVVQEGPGSLTATLDSIGDAPPEGVTVHVVTDVQAAIALSSAEFVLPIVAGTVIFEHGIRDLTALAAAGNAAVAYTDHASGQGDDLRPHYKPGWSPDRC